MDPKELREKTMEELQKSLDEKRVELEKFQMDLYIGKTKNVKQGRGIKKDVARILTTINQKKNGK